MFTKGNSKSLKTGFKALSARSATSKQLKTIQRPISDNFTNNSRLQPYLSRDDIQVRGNSQSPKMIPMKTKKNQRKRKIWTLPTSSDLPPAGLHCPEGVGHCNTHVRPKHSINLRIANGDRPSDSEREKYGMYKQSVIKQCPIANTASRDLPETVRYVDAERESYGITKFRTDKIVTEFNTERIPKPNDSKDALVTAEKSLGQSPTYVIPRTLTPERQLHSQDIMKLISELNNTRVNKPKKDNSDESILYDRKYGKLKRKTKKQRKSKRSAFYYISPSGMSTSTALGPENIPNESSAYPPTSNPTRPKNYSASNTSSFAYIPPVEMYEKPFGVVLRRKLKKVSGDLSKGTIVFHSHSKHSNTLELETNKGEKDITDNSALITTNISLGNNEFCYSKSSNKEFQKKYEYRAHSNENPTSLNMKICKFTDVNLYKGKFNSDNKNNSAPAAFKNIKKVMQKLTLNDIRRKLALLKFPIVVTGQDQCASFKIQDYEAPQFSPMPSTWKYMSGWSTDYEKDNSKPNKYLRLLQRQKYASKIMKIDWRTKKYGHRVPIEEKNKILRPGINYLNKKMSEQTNARMPKRFEDRDLKVLFQSNRDEKFDYKDVKYTSSLMMKSELPSIRIRQRDVFKAENTMKNNDNMKLSTYNSKIINNSVTTFIKMSRSKTDEQNTIYNTIRRLESNYFYDYSDWTQKSRKYPLKRKKNAVQLKSKSIAKVSSKEIRQQLSTKSFCKSIKKEVAWINNNEMIRKSVHNITSSRDALQLEERDITKNKENPKTVLSRKRINNYSWAYSAIVKASRVKAMTKLVNIYAPPTEIATKTQSAKPRKKTVPKHNNEELSKASTDIKTAVQDTTSYIPNQSQSENKIKIITTVPGFNENPNKIIIRTSERNEILLEDSLKNIQITFELTKTPREKCDHLHIHPQSFKDNFSLRLLNSGRIRHYRTNYKLCIVRLPEQVCSLWQLFLNKLDSETCKVTTESPNIAPIEPESYILVAENRKITKGTLYNNFNRTSYKPKLPNISQDLDQYLSLIDGILRKIKDLSFLQTYAPIERFSHPMDVKINRPEVQTSKMRTLTIHFDILTKYHSQDFKQYYMNEKVSYLENERCFRVKANNSLIRLHQENLPILSFSIPIRVIKNIIFFLANDYIFKQFFKMVEEKLPRVAVSDSTKETRKLKPVRKTASASKIKNEIREKLKNKLRNKSMSNIGEIHLRKTKPGKKKCRQHSSKKTENFQVNQVNDINDFMKIMWCGRGDVSSNTIDGQLAERILEDVNEFIIWSEDISPGQALLVMLLCSKPETKSLVKFRSALVHGIATKRIVSSTELDQECFAVEQDADVDCQDDDREILDELYDIAMKAASEHNHPFDETSEKTIASLLNRKRKLNLSYLRVMAKYVGFGLYSDK